MIKNPEVFYFIFGVKIKISKKWIFWTKILFWHSVYDQKIKNAQAMQLSTFRLLTKMTSGILRFLHLAQYMMWLMWRILTPRLRDRKYFVTLKYFFFQVLRQWSQQIRECTKRSSEWSIMRGNLPGMSALHRRLFSI